MAKGSQFERDFCKQLSLWWTEGETDEMFWRSSNSGGRATVRAKSGKSTKGQCGDVAAIHPDGVALIDLITFELKRGYSRSTIHDVFDKPKTAATQTWESWYEQATTSALINESFSWAIVHKRDRRDVMIYIPEFLFDALSMSECKPIIRFSTDLVVDKQVVSDTIVMLRWDSFMQLVEPCKVKALRDNLQNTL
jgi:hypothetical protein